MIGLNYPGPGTGVAGFGYDFKIKHIPVAGHWFLVTGFWSLVTGYWFLAPGLLLLVTAVGKEADPTLLPNA